LPFGNNGKAAAATNDELLKALLEGIQVRLAEAMKTEK